jgi:predicted transcriptional regulator
MSTDLTNDLAGFHQFVGNQLGRGTDLSPEQALAKWRERNETIHGVRRGIADIDAGRSRPADELISELREGLTPR